MKKYSPYLVTFFDILGFKNLLRFKSSKEVLEILKSIKKNIDPGSEYRKMFEMKSIAFSDSAIRAINIRSRSNLNHPSGLLYHEISDVALIQALLIHDHSVFIRGGMSVGDLCINRSIVFGQGLVNAYELESTKAVYPRIIVEEHLYDLIKLPNSLLKKLGHDTVTELEYLDNMLMVDDDGLRFINYLTAGSPEDYAFFSLLERHRDLVIQNAKATKSDSVLDKYHWAARYHNKVVDSHPDAYYESFEVDKSMYLIDDSEIPGLSEWSFGKVAKKCLSNKH